MIRYYCDACGDEITDVNRTPSPDRLRARREYQNGNTIEVELLSAVNGTWNAGQICKYCILDVVMKLDDRPRANK